MIIKTFIALRKLATNYQEVFDKLNEIEEAVSIHDNDIASLFKHMKKLLNNQNPPRRRIGFKPDD